MKIIKTPITEDFDYDSLLNHVKHVIQYKDDSRCAKEANNLINAINTFAAKYNQIANSLALSPAGLSTSNDDIVGYIQVDNNAAKYNKITGDFVVYNLRSPKLKSKTLHKKTYKEFIKTMQRYYLDELPENKT